MEEKKPDKPDIETPPITSPDAPVEPTVEVPAKPEAIAAVVQEIPEAPPVTPPTPETPSGEVAPDAGSSVGDDFGYTETKSNKLLYIFVFVLVVVLLSLVGLFFYKQYTNTTSPQQAEEVQPSLAVSPTTEPKSEEAVELDQIEIPDLDTELQDIEKDIEQL